MASTLCKVLLECMRRTPCVRLRAVHTRVHTRTPTRSLCDILSRRLGPAAPRAPASLDHAWAAALLTQGAGSGSLERGKRQSRAMVPAPRHQQGVVRLSQARPNTERQLWRARVLVSLLSAVRGSGQGARGAGLGLRPWQPGLRSVASTRVSPPVLASVSLSQGHRWHKKPSALQNKILLLLPREATLSSHKPAIPSLAIAEPPLCPAAGGWPC